MGPIVFTEQPVWGMLPDRTLAFVPSLGAQLSIVSNGTARAVATWKSRGRPVEDADILAHYRDFVLKRVVTGSDKSRQASEETFSAQMARNRRFFARQLPDVTGLTIDDEGHIWLRRADPRSAFAQSDWFDIFSASGAYLAEVQVPGIVNIFQILHRTVLGSVIDAQGREVLMKAKVAGPTLSGGRSLKTQ
jgi:hypothetical protein